MELTGKNILLTGASSGIGFELAKVLAAEKCKLALLNRRTDITEKLAEELTNSECEVISINCDVTKQNQVQAAIDQVINKFGKIDIAILNSGISGRSSINKFSPESAKQIFDVNVFGIFNCVKAILPIYIKQESGMIVGVSSLAEVRGFPKSGVYCASKAAASIFLESIRVELKKYNIKVLTVKPGFVKTPMTDKNEFKMPFLINAHKAAKIILQGIKKEKRIIHFPFPIVFSTKLLRILPNSIFDFLAGRI